MAIITDDNNYVTHPWNRTTVAVTTIPEQYKFTLTLWIRRTKYDKHYQWCSGVPWTSWPGVYNQNLPTEIVCSQAQLQFGKWNQSLVQIPWIYQKLGESEWHSLWYSLQDDDQAIQARRNEIHIGSAGGISENLFRPRPSRENAPVVKTELLMFIWKCWCLYV